MLYFDKGNAKRIECEYPEWINTEAMHMSSIQGTEKGFFVTGYYMLQEKEYSKNFALEFNEEGKLLKQYKLESPTQWGGITSACLYKNELYIATYNDVIYKFNIKL